MARRKKRTVIRDMDLHERRLRAGIELWNVHTQLQKIDSLIQVGAHGEEQEALEAALRKVSDAVMVLNKRTQTLEGRDLWPVNVTFDENGQFLSMDLGTTNGWARRSIHDKDGYNGLLDKVGG